MSSSSSRGSQGSASESLTPSSSSGSEGSSTSEASESVNSSSTAGSSPVSSEVSPGKAQMPGNATQSFNGTGNVTNPENRTITGNTTQSVNGTGNVTNPENRTITGNATQSVNGTGNVTNPENRTVTGNTTQSVNGTGNVTNPENRTITGNTTQSVNGTGNVTNPENRTITGNTTQSVNGTGNVTNPENGTSPEPLNYLWFLSLPIGLIAIYILAKKGIARKCIHQLGGGGDNADIYPSLGNIVGDIEMGPLEAKPPRKLGDLVNNYYAKTEKNEKKEILKQIYQLKIRELARMTPSEIEQNDVYSCPITFESLEADLTILPNGYFVSLSGIMQSLYFKKECPFSRRPLSENDLLTVGKAQVLEDIKEIKEIKEGDMSAGETKTYDVEIVVVL